MIAIYFKRNIKQRNSSSVFITELPYIESAAKRRTALASFLFALLNTYKLFLFIWLHPLAMNISDNNAKVMN